ncbi:4-hydroxy-3-methylbut-2-enyl diphosphate reductase [Thermosulfurimonas marina]|uniref:4-hydroxy-3-methylbut-2-enyl diphosphate reductase n=1 Tax=Thermosulfurimonas marina TaxID=2047767 RepID=A0A6H1WQZ5_9BACT|nr:4-hydroxy-3-methylbut-2-enyl diphosphate reductase [Thermosulfurimonas marina]QJA05580.1 4-hydroxy-3-methylbut-2-enyl diphosphate reductase [Thermosulfurimonas marina]
MKIEIARRAGFCMGVRRAMRLALRAAETAEKPVYTYGPLIHNPQALELLQKLGVEDLRKHLEAREGVVIIRAHGVPPEEKENLLRQGFEVVDGTCPRVARVQALARKYAREGYQVIIIGDQEHAEVKGILAYTEGRGLVVSNFGDLERLPPLEKYVILSQTTQDEEVFEVLSQEILSRFPGGQVINTICHATHVRQESIRELAARCEALVVVGGRGSANTNRLAQIAREEGREVFLVETPEELPLEKLASFRRLGVSAGASTPNWLINGVVERLKAYRNPWRRVLLLALYLHIPLFLSVAGLTAGADLLTGRSLFPVEPLVAFLLTFFAHTWNLLGARGFLSLCQPYKAAFYARHERVLVGTVVGSFLLALLLALKLDPLTFVTLALLGGLSALYSLTRLRSLFPGNRTLFISAYWVVLAAILSLPWENPVPLLLLLPLAFWQALYLDLLDLFEDGFVGKESLAALLGEKRAFRLLKILIALGAFVHLFLALGLELNLLVLFPLWAYLLGLTLYLQRRPLGRRLFLEYLGTSPGLVFFGLALLARGLS